VKYNQTKEFYEFGEFRLDVKKTRLFKNDELISLTPKEFEVLLMLVKHAGKVVEKDDLLDQIWADTFVEEATLTRNVSWLRKKLGADGEIIETVPKFGYRFLPEVRLVQNAEPILYEEQSIQKIVVEQTISIREEPPLQFPAKPKSKFIWLTAAVLLLSFGAVAFWFWQAKQSQKATFLQNVVPFSGLPGRENMPAFSPDGKQLAFVWDGDKGNLDVYVKLIGTGEPLRLTNNEANDLFPAFSPDGKQIAFLRSTPNSGEVYLIPALGGAERKICQVNSVWTSLSFSLDGKSLALIDSDKNDENWGIFLVNIETGEKKRLTVPPEFSVDSDPRFSSDGKQIAFLRVFGQTYEVFTVPATGGEPNQLTNDKSAVSGLTWDAKGENLIFASRRNGNQSNLWKISANGGEPEMLVTGGKNVVNPAISTDGKTIAFVEELRDTNIWQINISDQGNSETKLISSSRADHSPAFSPDGSKIVFASDRTSHYEIWVADADGKNQRQLTFLQQSAGSPRFSPDGKFIVFDSQEGQRSDVFVIPTEGGQARNLTASETREVLPSWSADGRFVYFTANKNGSNQLWKIPAEGGESVQITKNGAFESFASPDGKLIYFTKSRSEFGVWQITPEGTDEKPVNGLEEAAFWRYWTVNSEGVYFVPRTANPPYKIKAYDFKTLQIKDLATTNKSPIWIYAGFSVLPEKKILYTQFDQNSASIMLADFGK
jgi:Tol biopolymer transport system component/DNA-binding winged helix-turn-helix (wHTH) protein